MANAYETIAGETAEPTGAEQKLVFTGTQRNLAVGVAMLTASALAFSMKLTNVFFAEATAWTFALWGALFIYIGLMDIYQTYEVTDAGLIIRNPMRPWAATKLFDWPHLYRVDILVKRADAQHEDAEIQVYYTPEGEIAIEREDRVYDPELARLIIERANLKPTDPGNPTDLTTLPQGKATYVWNQSGRLAGGG